jgi:phospho-N-acetylmuramoyl-pentapeptide-transferase
MLLELFRWLEQLQSLFGLFGYLTFRGILSALTALALSLWWGPAMIRRSRCSRAASRSASDGPQSHFSKAGTPTMGGALILLTVLASVLLWGDLRNRYVWLVLAGDGRLRRDRLVDDWIKIVKRDPNGMKSRWKSAAVAVRPGAALFLYYTADHAGGDHVLHAVLQDVALPLVSDRLRRDRLLLDRRLLQRGEPDRRPRRPGDHADRAGGVRARRVRVCVGQRGVLRIPADPAGPGAGELVIICAAIAGAGLGFLWFNTYPAMVFMGDIGALALGAALGTIAVIVRQESCW